MSAALIFALATLAAIAAIGIWLAIDCARYSRRQREIADARAEIMRAMRGGETSESYGRMP